MAGRTARSSKPLLASHWDVAVVVAGRRRAMTAWNLPSLGLRVLFDKQGQSTAFLGQPLGSRGQNRGGDHHGRKPASREPPKTTLTRCRSPATPRGRLRAARRVQAPACVVERLPAAGRGHGAVRSQAMGGAGSTHLGGRPQPTRPGAAMPQDPARTGGALVGALESGGQAADRACWSMRSGPAALKALGRTGPLPRVWQGSPGRWPAVGAGLRGQAVVLSPSGGGGHTC